VTVVELQTVAAHPPKIHVVADIVDIRTLDFYKAEGGFERAK